ncbi:MAG: hypothetical protein D4R64_14585 [Porphyromonadaceae bacterium]|nr:MAG: hypothetical protein D4R64_14585 [Porphyromonadaceae bacterium]
MRITKNIVIGLLMLIVFHSYALGQNRIDSLQLIFDRHKVPDSIYVKTSVELCKALVNTDNEFLLPEYALKGLEADTLNRDIQSKFALYEYLGNYYWQVGKLNEAADQFNKMRLIGETFSDTHITANSFNGLGTVYYLIDDYDQALAYYRKGLDLSGADSLLKVRFYTNIANTFKQQGKMDSVLPYYNKSVTYHQYHQNFRYLSIVYGNIAITYNELHNSQEVRRNLNLALEAAIKADDPYQIAAVYQIMGDLVFERHPNIAVKSYSQVLELARKSQSYDQIQKSLKALSLLSEKAGKYKESISYLREIKGLDDSLDLEQRKSRIRQMESEHLAAIRNAAEIKKAQQEELKANRDQNRQMEMLIILAIAFAAVLILFLMGFQTYRLKMKITRTKERFFSMIAHDIRSPFSGILGLSGLLNEEAEKNEDPGHRKRVRSLHQSLNQVYELLENLLEWSQAETGKIAFNPSVQLLSPFVHEVIFLLTASGKQKGIRLENQIQSGLTARFDSNMLQTIIRNLLSNAIKFSQENSSIFLSAEIHGKEVVVKVRDEGIGMNHEQIDRIFKRDEGSSTPGTRNETGTGLGLMLCKDFIARHGGRIWVDSKPGEGTTVFFTLPDHAGKF